MRTLRPLLLICFAVVLSGCFQTKALIRLNADGSGTVEETVLMNSMMSMSIGMGSGGFLEDSDDAPDMAEDGPYSMEQLQTRAAEMGTTLVGVEPIDILFGAGYTATYAFTDINSLRFGSNPLEGMGGMMSEMGRAGDASGDEPITFAYSRGRLTVRMPEPAFDDEEDLFGDDEIVDEPAEIDFDAPARDPKKNPAYGEEYAFEDDLFSDDSSQEDEMRQMAAMFKDMKFSIAVELPSDVRETNASHASGRILTLFDMDFGLLAETPGVFDDLEALGMSGPPSSMSAMEVFQNIPGFTYEPEREVTVSF
ncbi:hypothetical protein [Rubricoccus marinus]|uniref:Uncharacterized protein n=1 Tax=Rubricoccus marinus TaxID=716817 RepID=A0A259U2G9_9BACT|nr:hypothetical protein [Rubricoccus marinus]OZC04136.1 hypothetical protein BSZ36_14780 [Rubricoccus marinus]